MQSQVSQRSLLRSCRTNSRGRYEEQSRTYALVPHGPQLTCRLFPFATMISSASLNSTLSTIHWQVRPTFVSPRTQASAPFLSRSAHAPYDESRSAPVIHRAPHPVSLSIVRHMSTPHPTFPPSDLTPSFRAPIPPHRPPPLMHRCPPLARALSGPCIDLDLQKQAQARGPRHINAPLDIDALLSIDPLGGSGFRRVIQS